MRACLVPDAILSALPLIVFILTRALKADHASVTDEETGVEGRWLPQVTEQTHSRAGSWAEEGRLCCGLSLPSVGRQAHTPVLWIIDKVALPCAGKQDLPITNWLGRVLRIVLLRTIRSFLLKEKGPEIHSIFCYPQDSVHNTTVLVAPHSGPAGCLVKASS